MNENEFLEKYAPIVYNLALRLTGKQADAEDLAQDALLRALKGLAEFRGDSRISTWLYRITVNTWKNRVRSEKRRGFWQTMPIHLFSEDERSGEEALKADDPPLDADLESEEKSRAVQEALMELDDESRAIILLRDLKGQSYQEIAQALQIPEGTVKSRISRARSVLKLKLKRYVEDFLGNKP